MLRAAWLFHTLSFTLSSPLDSLPTFTRTLCTSAYTCCTETDLCWSTGSTSAAAACQQEDNERRGWCSARHWHGIDLVCLRDGMMTHMGSIRDGSECKILSALSRVYEATNFQAIELMWREGERGMFMDFRLWEAGGTSDIRIQFILDILVVSSISVGFH